MGSFITEQPNMLDSSQNKSTPFVDNSHNELQGSAGKLFEKRIYIAQRWVHNQQVKRHQNTPL